MNMTASLASLGMSKESERRRQARRAAHRQERITSIEAAKAGFESRIEEMVHSMVARGVISPWDVGMLFLRASAYMAEAQLAGEPPEFMIANAERIIRGEPTVPLRTTARPVRRGGRFLKPRK